MRVASNMRHDTYSTQLPLRNESWDLKHKTIVVIIAMETICTHAQMHTDTQTHIHAHAHTHTNIHAQCV